MSDEESTQEIDIDALRERARSSVNDLEDSIESSTASPHDPHDRETARGRPEDRDADRTVMAPAPNGPRIGRTQTSDSISVEIDMGLSADEDGVYNGDNDDVEDVSDDDDVALVTNDSRQDVDPEYLDRIRHPERYAGDPSTYGDAPPSFGEHPPHSQATQFDRDDMYGDSDPHAPLAQFEDPNAGQYDRPHDEPHSLIGTMPGHDVAQALRAMMGDVPDTPLTDDLEEPPISKPTWEPRKISPNPTSMDEGVTMTRLPEPDAIEALLNSTSEEDSLPAFSLDESYDEPERDDVLTTGPGGLPPERGPLHR